MNKKLIIALSIIHAMLVLLFMVVFDYQFSPDSYRYIGVADEITSLKFTFSPSLNCNTAPGYPIFLGVIKFITWHNKYLINCIQALLFALALFYFVEAIRKKYEISKNICLVFFAFVLISPEFIHMNGSVSTESLCAILILFICGVFINGYTTNQDKYLHVISFIFLVLTKMEYLLLLLLIIPFLFRFRKFKLLALTLFGVFSVFVLNGIKNKKTFGRFNLTSYGSGTVIYGGNNLNLNGSWQKHGVVKNYVPKKYDMAFDSIRKSNPKNGCRQEDSLYKKMAIEAWQINYKNQLKVIPVKMAKLWLLPGSFDFYTGQTEIFRGLQLDKLFSDKLWPWYGKYKHALYLIVYWFYLMLSFIGLYLKFKTKGFDELDFFFFSILFFNTAMYSIPFYGLGRFHLPVITILFYYAVYTLIAFSKYTNKRNFFDSKSRVYG